jgi:protein wnt-7b
MKIHNSPLLLLTIICYFWVTFVGSRETAFLYAITSSGVVHSLAQACSAGNLTNCSCDRSKRSINTADGWKWGGCSDNVRYAINFAKQFVDAPEKAAFRKNRDLQAIMNLHNNHAGRLVSVHQSIKR